LITLVAIGESAIDQRLNVLRARLGLLCHDAGAKARVKRAARLSGVTRRRTRSGLSDVRDHAAERGQAGDAINEDDCRQYVVAFARSTRENISVSSASSASMSLLTSINPIT
jgi:hypothetical protein